MGCHASKHKDSPQADYTVKSRVRANAPEGA